MSEADTAFADISLPGPRRTAGHARRVIALAVRTAPGLMGVIAALSLFAALAPAGIAWLGKLVIDTVLRAIETGAAADRGAAIGYVLAEAGLVAGLLATRRLMTFYKRALHARLGHEVNRLIFSKSLRLDLQTLEEAGVQQQILLARQHATARPYGLVMRIIEFAQHTVTLVSLAAVLATFSPLAVLLIVFGGLPLFLNELGFSGAMFRLYTGRTPEVRQRNYLEGLMISDSAAPERIHAGADAAITQRYEGLFARIHDEDRSRHHRHAWIGVGLIAVSSAIFIAGKVWIVLVTLGGAITLGAMTMHIAVLKQGQNTVTSLLASLNGGYEDLLYVSNLYALLELDEGRPRGTAREGPLPGDGYRLEGVGFRYDRAARPALTGISLHIPEGHRLGIAGANGSGKSTLIKLLTGLYLPTEGRILLDGLELSEWSPETLFERTAVLFQPYQRYRLTAGDNIAMGKGLRQTGRADLLEAAERGLAQSVLDDLPDGLDTRLSRQFLDGRELSGGQWQRLALARAMLRTGAKTLILDEPTSALDPAGEAEFIETAAKTDRTVILISHRLANLRASDTILVLDKGRIAEQGTHEDLMARGELYKDMFDTQAGFYAKASG